MARLMDCWIIDITPESIVQVYTNSKKYVYDVSKKNEATSVSHDYQVGNFVIDHQLNFTNANWTFKNLSSAICYSII